MCKSSAVFQTTLVAVCMMDMTFPSGLARQLWTLVVAKTLLLQNGNSPELLLCVLHGYTHSAISVFYCHSRHRVQTS